MSSHSRLSHKRFNDEVAIIVKDLGSRLQHLLEQHETFLLNNNPACEEDKPQEMNPIFIKGPSTAPMCPSKGKLLAEFSKVVPGDDTPTAVLTLAGCVDEGDAAGSDPVAQAPSAFGQRASLMHEMELRTHWNEVSMDAQLEAVKCLESYSHNEQDARARFRSRVGMEQRKTQIPSVDGTSWVVGGTCCEVMHPSCRTRTIWNFIALGLIVQDMLTIPLLVFDVGNTTPWEIFAWFCTIYWTADMFMSARTGFLVGAKVEMRQKPILINYAKTWLVLDTFIVLFEWFSRFFNTLAPPSLIRTTRAVRIVRLVKLVRIAKMKDLVNEFAARINSNALYLVLRIVFLTLVLCVATHFITCMWYGIGTSASDGWTSYDTYAIRDDDQSDFLYWYVSSARWAISQLNGRTDMDERRNMRERGFTAIGGVVFAIVGQAIFVSLITKSMIELSSLFKEQKQKRRIVNEYLSFYPIPAVLERCVKVLAKQHKDVNAERKKEGVVLSLLPRHLQTELLYETRRPFMNAHPLFKCVLGEFFSTSRHICQNVVRQVHAVSEEVMFNPGDACARMLMMDMGSLIYGVCDTTKAMMQRGFSTQELLSQLAIDGERLSRGQWVAEASLWCVWHNKGTLITDDSCCMLEIDAMLFATEIREHNDALPVISVYAKNFIDYLNKQEELTDLVKRFIIFGGSDLAARFSSEEARRHSEEPPTGSSRKYQECGHGQRVGFLD